MKKLLSLLSAATIGSTVPTTAVYAFSVPNNHTTDKVAAYSSSHIASALIQKDEAGYNSESFLNTEMFMDPNASNTSFAKFQNDPTHYSIAAGLNHTFGTDNAKDLSLLIDKSSPVQDTDATNPGQNAAPSSIQGIVSILQMIQNSNNTLKDPSQLFELIKDLNIPKLIGGTLSSLIGTNAVFDAINNIPLSVFSSALNGFDAANKGKQYMTYTENSDNPNFYLTGNSGTVMYDVIFSGNFLTATMPDLMNGKPLTNDDYTNLANLVLAILNYISQFTFTAKASDGDHLYSDSQTNEDFRASIDSSTFKTTNYDNLGTLIQNVLNYGNNNGLGFQQIIDTIFGSSKSLIVSSDYHNPNAFDLDLVPDHRYYNPFMTDIQYVLVLAIALGQIKIPGISPDIMNLLLAHDVFSQLITLLGGFLDEVATNRTVDNSVNVLKFVEVNIKNILNDFGIQIPQAQLKTLLIDLDNLITRLEPRFAYGWMSMDDTYDPSVDPFMSIRSYEENGSTWNDLWNHNQNTDTVWGATSSVLNDVFNIAGIKVDLPKEFDGFKSIIDGLLSQEIPGLSLTYGQLIQELDEQNGILQFITKNLGAIEKFAQSILTATTDPTMLKSAEDWIDKNVDVTKAPKDIQKQLTDLINRYKNKQEFNLLHVFEIISLASSVGDKGAFVDGVTLDAANNQLMSWIGYTTDKSKIDPNSIYGLLTNNWDLLSGMIAAAVNSGQAILSPFFDKIKNIMDDYTVEDGSITQDKKSGEIKYVLDDNYSKGKVTYNVDLTLSNGFYTIKSISKS